MFLLVPVEVDLFDFISSSKEVCLPITNFHCTNAYMSAFASEDLMRSVV